MRPTYLLRPQVSRFISLLVCSAVLVSIFVATPRSAAKSPRKTKPPAPPVIPQGNSQRQRQPAPHDAGRHVDPVPPERGAPMANLPSLDELRHRKPAKPEAPPPIPSTTRSRRKTFRSDNKQSGLSIPFGKSAAVRLASSRGTRTTNGTSLKSHHARAASAMPQGNGLTNLALNKPATQSSTYQGAGGAVPQLAVDGNTSGNWSDGSVTHTNYDAAAWWRVDLGSTYAIESVEVWNRTDCCGNRLTNFNVILRDNNQNVVNSVNFPGQAGTPSTISISGAARYVQIQLVGTNYLSLAEVRVWGTAIAGASDSERAMARLDPFNQPGDRLTAWVLTR